MALYEESTQLTQPTQLVEEFTQIAEPQEDELTQVRNGKRAFGKIVGRKGEKVFDSPISSNRHCRIFGEQSNGPEEFLIVCEDTSSNGTFLNGQKIGKGNTVMLTHGDTLEIKKGHYFTYLQTVTTSSNSQSKELDLDSKYQITDKILGSGTFAEVRLVLRKDTKEQLAVKIMEKRNFSTAGAVGGGTNYIQEINLLRAIDHANIVRVYDVFETEKHVYIFMPLISGGDLFDYILSNARLPEEEAKFHTYQLMLALKYLHERNITHRDVKPENILVESKEPFSRIMLTDFGMAKAVGQQSFLKTMCGTFQYIAPEIIQTNMGSMLPFSGDDGEAMLFSHILSGHLDFTNEVWDSVSDNAMSFIKMLLKINPRARMSINDAFEHPWIKSCEEELAILYSRRVPTDEPSSSINSKDDGGDSRMSISEPSDSPLPTARNVNIDDHGSDTTCVTKTAKNSPEKRPNNDLSMQVSGPSRKNRRIESLGEL
ncbi:hypothetical protein H4219_000595 [Mycoemilia scoparia]|uniref:Uncharacterized protein n=1 Tax=Mycoemilia scoparia TaxID=417184 RepID=A0A9W8A6P3_9FUNG|nr:hypothetical protein H4219_000595 [Mycoemilia scoparia]